jgi:hypothetical protein
VALVSDVVNTFEKMLYVMKAKALINKEAKKQDAGKRKTTMWTVILVVQAETQHGTRTPGTTSNTYKPTVTAIGTTTSIATGTAGKIETAETDASGTGSTTIAVMATTETAVDQDQDQKADLRLHSINMMWKIMEAGEASREAEAAAGQGHEHGLVTSKTNVPLFTLGRAATAQKEKEKAEADKTTEAEAADPGTEQHAGSRF